jgi:GAF domain-containing protein
VTGLQNEQHRLECLHNYQILDTLPEASFDRLTRLVANIFNAPMALLSLVDKDRQWFKSRHGLDVCETPRSISFCQHTILCDHVFIVPDATKDEQFAQNPLVTGFPHIRFYAGAPLRSPQGYRIGTLCVIDTTARTGVFDSERAALQDLATIVVDELELRLSLLKATGNTATPGA